MKRIIFFGAVAVLAVVGVALTSPSVDRSPAQSATVGITSVAAADSLASAASNNARLIAWRSSGYPAGLGVNVNLLRRTSADPQQFVLVRAIAAGTENDGELLWIPEAGESGSDLFIEVTCAPDAGESGCSISSEPIPAY